MADFKAQLEDLSEKLMDDSYAQALYAALCNVIWVHKETSEQYSCTWRYAGELIAGLRDVGENYLDFYCSGFSGNDMPEGLVRKDIEEDLGELGWYPTQYPED